MLKAVILGLAGYKQIKEERDREKEEMEKEKDYIVK